jgi:hypothetical protein
MTHYVLRAAGLCFDLYAEDQAEAERKAEAHLVADQFVPELVGTLYRVDPDRNVEVARLGPMPPRGSR